MKRVFSLFVALFLMSNGFSASMLDCESVPSYGVGYDIDCHEQVYMATVMADAAGYSIEEVEWISQVALAIYCYGYSMDDF